VKYNGFGSVSAEWGLPKCLWLKEREPRTWQEARHICDATGPVLGSAILGAVGAGLYPDIRTAVAQMVHTDRTLEPDPDRHEEYKFYVDSYIETYERMKEPMHRMTRHVAATGASAPADR